MNLLLACEGEWQGTSALFLPGVEPESSASKLVVVPVLGGKFMRFDYDWGYQGKPQQGSLLAGGDSACWIDTWHMSDKMLICTAETGAGVWSCRGSYPAPPGPDWGWRIEISVQADGMLQLKMFNIEPGGSSEEIAVDAVYSRAATELRRAAS